MRSGKRLTEAEVAEGWAAYQRGVKTYVISRALGCGMRELARAFAEHGYPVRRTWTRPKVLKRIRELARDARVGEEEVVWAALHLVNAQQVEREVTAALKDGRLVATRPVARQNWQRAKYKNKMHGGG